MHQGKNQIAASFQQMQHNFQETNQGLLSIRVKNEQLQKNSRIFDQRQASERLAKIQQQAIASNKKNTALEIKWSELKEYEQCESLAKAITQQKEAFKTIVSGKDRLIAQFWDELKRKDDQYSKALKEQAVDIKLLVGKMREQYFALRDQSLKELEEVQRKFEAERKSYIEKAKTQVDECFKRHINMQQSFAESRRRAQQQFQKTIQKLRVQGMQTYSTTKIKMQNDIQNLQKCYQQMKALYQLNTEKLDYNLKILKEKREQNHEKHDDLKKKERALNFRLRKLREEYQKADQKFKQDNKLLTSEYKRITRQFKQLQRKFKHFEKADLQKYNQIQAMNQQDVHAIKDKILKCDVVIHNQQLGMEWTNVEDLQTPVDDKPPTYEEQTEEVSLVVSQVKLGQLLDILIQEADFVFDDKMREELERASQEEKLKEKLEILKKTLSIDSIDELNMFIEQMANSCKYVSEKEKHAIELQRLQRQQQARQQQQRAMKKNKRKVQQKKSQQKQKQKQIIKPTQTDILERIDLASDFKIDPVLVVDFLIEWMNGREERKKLLERTTKKSLKQLSDREKKDLIAREGKKYWEKMTQVLPERTFRVWRVLERALSSYHALLISRQNLIKETGDMHNQNEELKNLLNQYLQINHELIIPPTRLMEKGGN